VVDDVVTGGVQVLDEGDLELVAGVVGGDVDAHGVILPHRPVCPPRRPGPPCA
jgi:hypothetical protein